MNGHSGGCTGETTCRCEAKRYWLILAISLVILAAEVAGGILSGSLALLSDAAHVFADMIAIVTAIIVESGVRKWRDRESRYRGTGALIHGLLLLLVAGGICAEAHRRFQKVIEIEIGVMTIVAIFGAACNYVQHRLLLRSHVRNITHRGIDFHVLSDLWQSLTVTGGALLIGATGWVFIDLVASVLIALVIAFWGLRLILWGKELCAHSHS